MKIIAVKAMYYVRYLKYNFIFTHLNSTILKFKIAC